MRRSTFIFFVKSLLLIIVCSLIITSNVGAQIKIGLNGARIEPASLLELESLNQGFLLPRLPDTIEINALNPPDGMLVYITKSPASGLYIRKGGAWVPVQLSSSKMDASTISDDGLTIKLNNTGNNKIFSANSDTSLWNANKLQGYPISKNGPLKGQLLEWDGSTWVPTNPFRDLSGMTGLINSAQLSAGSVTAEKISDGSITAAKIGTGYGNERVLVTDITGNATWVDRSTFSINTLSLGSIYIGNADGVATPQTVTGDISLTSSGLSSIGSGKVTTSMILDETIGAADIATGAILTDKLQDRAITPAKLAEMAGLSFIGRKTTGLGTAEVISATDAKSMLSLSKNDVGLANVENTSDANKPISTVAQASLDGKLDKVLKVAEIIVTSPTSTLAIKGLEVSSSAQNEVVTINPLTGVLSRSSFVSTAEQSVVDYTAAEGQLLFTTPGPITTINKVNVYRNGIRINASVVDVNTIKLESGAVCYLNDEVKIIQFK